jgi:hypothetical protein
VKTTIEINGQKYDAKTGKVLRHSAVNSASLPKTTPSKLKHPISNGKTIDGVTRNHSHQNLQPGKVATALAKPQAIAHKLSQVRMPAQPVHRTIEKSRTLLRNAVKKPLSIAGIHSTSTLIGDQNTATTNNRRPLPAPVRTATISAKRIVQSSTISHFGAISRNSFTKVVSSLGVAMPPATLEASPPLIFGKHGKTKAEKPQVFNHRIAKANYQTSPKSPSEKLAKRLSRRLKVKPKMAAICITILAVLCLGGFFAYQNIPSVAMRVAARGAGFNGRLPEDIPAGYSFKGPITYTKNSITLNYHSNSEDRQFTITQKPKDWTSDSLLANYLIANNLQWQTSVSDGLTIFVYNEGNATWIDKGIWFTITGEGSLSTNQLLSIASSF